MIQVGRLLGIAVVLMTGQVVGAGAAAGKMPYFSIEIEPMSPVVGQPLLISVRFWHDVAHTEPTATGHISLEGLVAVRPADGEGPDIQVRLVRGGRSQEMRGSVLVPTPGRWAVVAFPDRSGWSSPLVPAGYPDTIFISVRGGTAATALSTERPNASLPSMFAVPLAALPVLVAVLRGRHHSRRRRCLERTPGSMR